ncbi:protein containing DUF1626 [Candidatus Thiomargarita nelsonii]|uniref:Protein containing DUF1626 n=1 Tax=Candidatus Thiomargarita nelsonii TaxID=1003181 RepID=A0A176S533_9GAMM|nr:protein containing DUF1626 [Candidatus Thiomargarita nelsonii]
MVTDFSYRRNDKSANCDDVKYIIAPTLEVKMLTEKDFSQIQNYLIEILPQLLRQQPEIATSVKAIVTQQLPGQNETVRLLEEIKLLREDTHRHFEQVEHRIEQVEHRFEQVERRIEQVEHRFEQVEQRIEQVGQRIEQVEQRFEQTERQIELLRDEMNQRFAQVDQRFAQVDQRFDKVDQRFDKVEQRLDKQHQDFVDFKRRMIKVESIVERTNEKITQFDAWLKIVTGNVGDEKGQALEQLFALGLSYGLKNRDVLPETIQLRQQFEDTEGLVYLRKGKFIEVDIIAENGQLTVFEVKASAVGTDVDQFVRKVKLIQLQNPDKQVQGIFISPGAKEEVKQCCTEYEIELLD